MATLDSDQFQFEGSTDKTVVQIQTDAAGGGNPAPDHTVVYPSDSGTKLVQVFYTAPLTAGQQTQLDTNLIADGMDPDL